MAESKNGKETYTVLWDIKNFGFIMDNRKMVSSTFVIESLYSSRWQLELLIKREEKKIACFLRMCHCRIEPILASYEFCIIGADKTTEFQNLLIDEYNFTISSRCGYDPYMDLGTVFNKPEIMHNGILTIRCVIWGHANSKGVTEVVSNVMNVPSTRFPPNISFENLKNEVGKYFHYANYLHMVTTVSVQRLALTWTLNEFSSIDSHIIVQIPIKMPQSEYFQFILTLTVSVKGDIMLTLTSLSSMSKVVEIKLFVIDNKGKKRFKCRKFRLFETRRKDNSRIFSYLNKHTILAKHKDDYLVDDKLILHFQLSVSSGGYGGFIEKSIYKSTNEESRNVLQTSLDIIEAYVKVFTSEGFCDVIIKCGSKLFPCHKVILSARSPVFHAIFVHNMRESNQNSVNVSNVEPDIMRRMLMYMYTDLLCELDVESAILLYEASDCYDILSLRCKCFVYLKNNVSFDNAVEIYNLACMHSDVDLKSDVLNFLFEKSSMWLESAKWRELVQTDVILASELLMYISAHIAKL